MLKKIIFGFIAIALAAWAGITLYQNKKEINEAATPKKETGQIPVTVAQVAVQTLSSDFSYIGTFMPIREVPIAAEGGGKILKVLVKEGDYVKQGQILAQVDNEMLKLKLNAEVAAVETQRLAAQTALNGVESAQNSLNAAKTALASAQAARQNALTMVNKAKTDVTRFENLMKENATTDMNLQNAKMGVVQAENGLTQADAAVNQAQNGINQAEMGVKQAQMQVNQVQFGIKQAETQVETTKKMIAQSDLKAPISGIITAKSFDVGSMIGAGTPIGMVTDISTLKLTVAIPEMDILKFKEGQAVKVLADLYSGIQFNGMVSLISVKSDNAHGYKVEISVPNTQTNPIKAGMYGRLMGTSKDGMTGVFIPRGVVIGSIQDPKVYLAQGAKAVLTPIVLGASSGDFLEVKEGLKVGDKLVTSGQINLDDGSPISIINDQPTTTAQ